MYTNTDTNEKRQLQALEISLLVLALAAILLALSPIVKKPRPLEFSLSVPFTTQAPTGNWQGNENCEEASATMAWAYLSGNSSDVLPAALANQKISDLISWEDSNLGHNANTGAFETREMIEAVLALKTEILTDFNENALKDALVANKVLLLPLNAQLLNGANYKQIKPTYHMVVIRAYNVKGFLVNDPGTNIGKSQFYSFEQLEKAAADWDNTSNSLDSSTKVVVAVSK